LSEEAKIPPQSHQAFACIWLEQPKRDPGPEIALFRLRGLPLPICRNEFAAAWSVASPLHLILQFVEQPAEFRRVLLGARESDWPIRCGTEVGVQEAVQFDGCALEPSSFHFRPRVVNSESILRRLGARRKVLAKGIF
jgi:hypothetical protein